MKRIILCISILSIMLGFALFGLLKIKSCTETISVQLDNIIVSLNNNDSQGALQIAKSAKQSWENNSFYTFIFLNQNEVMEVNSALAQIIGMIERDCDEINAECLWLKSYIALVYNTQLPFLENIL